MPHQANATTVRILREDKSTLEWLNNQFGLNSLTATQQMLLRYASTPEGNRALKEFMVQSLIKSRPPESIYPLAEFPAGR